MLGLHWTRPSCSQLYVMASGDLVFRISLLCHARPQQLSEAWRKNLWSPHPCSSQSSQTTALWIAPPSLLANSGWTLPALSHAAMTFVCTVILFWTFSRNREPFKLSSFTSWKLTREVFCPLHTIPIVLQPRKSGFHSLMVPFSLTSQPLFRCVHWLQQKLPSALFLSKPYILYFFMSHVLFFILDLPNSYQSPPIHRLGIILALPNKSVQSLLVQPALDKVSGQGQKASLAKISHDWPLGQLPIFKSESSIFYVALSTTIFQAPKRLSC